MLDLHARYRDRMHTFTKTCVLRRSDLLFRADILDPDQHCRLVQPEVITDLFEHGIGSTEDHESRRKILCQCFSHDGRTARILEKCLTHRLELRRRFLGRVAGNDAASVDQKTVIDDVFDVILFGNTDRTGAFTGSG